MLRCGIALKLSILLWMAAASLPEGVHAQADTGVQVETELVAEVRLAIPSSSGGAETYRYVPASILAQGDVVYYTVRIRNPAPVVARNVQVVQRIPANTSYVPGSAAGPGAEVEFSVDGGQTFAAEGRLSVTDPETGSVRRAQPVDYTHIRWVLRNPIAANAVALARFRAVFR